MRNWSLVFPPWLPDPGSLFMSRFARLVLPPRERGRNTKTTSIVTNAESWPLSADVATQVLTYRLT